MRQLVGKRIGKFTAVAAVGHAGQFDRIGADLDFNVAVLTALDEKQAVAAQSESFR